MIDYKGENPQISAIIFKKNKIDKVEDFIKSEIFHLNVLTNNMKQQPYTLTKHLLPFVPTNLVEDSSLLCI